MTLSEITHIDLLELGWELKTGKKTSPSHLLPGNDAYL